MLDVGILLSNDHRLGDEEDGGRTEEIYQMELYKTTGGHRLRSLLASTNIKRRTHAGKDSQARQ